MKRPGKIGVYRRLEALYDNMQSEFNAVAGPVGFTCEDCTQNCCVSFFQHHTYVEWAFLWKGLKAKPAAEMGEILERSKEYVDHARTMLAAGERPNMLCPLNKDGLCQAYEHRLMICRLHGVPHTLAGRGGRQEYPGCFRFDEFAGGAEVTPMDRTPLYRRLAKIELDYLGNKAGNLPKVDLTTAEMILAGPPNL
jgi:Fe-S-cluster containining protein